MDPIRGFYFRLARISREIIGRRRNETAEIRELERHASAAPSNYFPVRVR